MKADGGRPKHVPEAYWDAIWAEHLQEARSELCGRLQAAGRGSGLTLSPVECRILLALLRPPLKPSHGRPKKNWDHILDMAIYSSGLERRLSATAAVEATAKKFGCKPATVWAARKAVLFDSK